MDSEEAKKFLQKAFIAFPGLREWLHATGTPTETIGTWVRTLQRVAYQDAVEVLDGWIDGSIPNPPIGFRREVFAIDVRECSKKFSEERYREQQREQQWLKQNRFKLQSSLRYTPVGPAMARIFEFGEQRRRGEISQDECEREIQLVVDETCDLIDGVKT